MTLKSDAKFEEKLTLGSKNDMRNLVNFNVSSGKSENLHFHVLFLLIASKVSAEKVVWAKKNTEELCCRKWYNDKVLGEFPHK